MGKRSAISLNKKAALCAQHALHQHTSNKDLQTWFEVTFNQKITSSSVSEILSKKYAFLNNHNTKNLTSLKQHQQEHWPELEQALYEWMQQAEGQIAITGDVLKQKAQQFWTQLDVYKDKDVPTFSNGWLQNFQTWKAIRYCMQHGEEGSVQEASAEDMKAI